MTDTVVVHEPQIIVTVAQPGLPGPPGPPGPRGADGIGAISADAGNAIAQGSDGGLYCPAVIQSTLHW